MAMSLIQSTLSRLTLIKMVPGYKNSNYILSGTRTSCLVSLIVQRFPLMRILMKVVGFQLASIWRHRAM